MVEIQSCDFISFAVVDEDDIGGKSLRMTDICLCDRNIQEQNIDVISAHSDAMRDTDCAGLIITNLFSPCGVIFVS